MNNHQRATEKHPTLYINHDCCFFPPLPFSCTLILAIKHQSLFIYFSYLGSKGLERRSGGVGDEETADTGGGKLRLVHKARRNVLFSSPLCCELVVE